MTFTFETERLYINNDEIVIPITTSIQVDRDWFLEAKSSIESRNYSYPNNICHFEVIENPYPAFGVSEYLINYVVNYPYDNCDPKLVEEDMKKQKILFENLTIDANKKLKERIENKEKMMKLADNLKQYFSKGE